MLSVAAFTCAFVFVAMLGFSLPPSDSAYGLSLSQRLSDPFVSNGAILGGIFFGLVLISLCLLYTSQAAPKYRRILCVCRGLGRDRDCDSLWRMAWTIYSSPRSQARSSFVGTRDGEFSSRLSRPDVIARQDKQWTHMPVLRYVELKTGYDDNGPAWIERVSVAFWPDHLLQRSRVEAKRRPRIRGKLL